MLLVVVAAVWTLSRVQAPASSTPVDAAFLERFSVSRYHVMERLFEDADFRFLESSPGYHPQIAKRLRERRMRVLRMLLRRIKSDFLRMHEAARVAILFSREDRPELAAILMRQRLNFALQLAGVELRLLLAELGIGNVPRTGLVATLDSMRAQLATAARPQTLAQNA
ncbi:MAG: hypothetical protein K2X35_22910 [Bryobacteraceae bacterium]|nr:hypothetical protein [Bryobacteraceae bacterium]